MPPSNSSYAVMRKLASYTIPEKDYVRDPLHLLVDWNLQLLTCPFRPQYGPLRRYMPISSNLALKTASITIKQRQTHNQAGYATWLQSSIAIYLSKSAQLDNTCTAHWNH